MNHWNSRNFKRYLSDAEQICPDWRTAQNLAVQSSHKGRSLTSEKMKWQIKILTNNSLIGRAKAGCEIDRKRWGNRSASLVLGVGREASGGGKEVPKVRAAPMSQKPVVEWEHTKHLKHSLNLGQPCWGVRSQVDKVSTITSWQIDGVTMETMIGGEGDDRGWDGWMVLPTRWTWIWASSGRWWWTGKPGVLQSMRLQRVGHDWATELIYHLWHLFIFSQRKIFKVFK